LTLDVPSAGPPCFRPQAIRYHLTRDSNVEIFIQRFEAGGGALPVQEAKVFEGAQLATDGVTPITFVPGPRSSWT